jgi:hypothetical protein
MCSAWGAIAGASVVRAGAIALCKKSRDDHA